jgi:uncharacterized protein (DUF427 family)
LAATDTFRGKRCAWIYCGQSDLVCPNGVQFYDVTDGAAQSRRAAWSYEAPRTGMQQVDHWVAFWEDVDIK